MNVKLECEDELREWTRRGSEYFFYEEGFYTLPLNSEIPEETKFYFAGERVLMRSIFNSPFTNIQVGFFNWFNSFSTFDQVASTGKK